MQQCAHRGQVGPRDLLVRGRSSGFERPLSGLRLICSLSLPESSILVRWKTKFV